VGACSGAQAEGSVWRALGIMTAAGSLRNAALLLRELKMPDAAAAFSAACKEAGFHSPFAPVDAGARSALLHIRSHARRLPPWPSVARCRLHCASRKGPSVWCAGLFCDTEASTSTWGKHAERFANALGQGAWRTCSTILGTRRPRGARA
jgi:hypothetical protein